MLILITGLCLCPFSPELGLGTLAVWLILD